MEISYTETLNFEKLRIVILDIGPEYIKCLSLSYNHTFKMDFSRALGRFIYNHSYTQLAKREPYGTCYKEAELYLANEYKIQPQEESING